MASSALCPAHTLDLGRRGWLPLLPRRVSAHSGQPPLTRARREEGRGEGGADNGPGPGVARSGDWWSLQAGRRATAGGALLSSAPGRVQPLPEFMLVVPPSPPRWGSCGVPAFLCPLRSSACNRAVKAGRAGPGCLSPGNRHYLSCRPLHPAGRAEPGLEALCP